MSVVVIALAMLLVAVLAAEPLLAAWPARRAKPHPDSQVPAGPTKLRVP